MISTRVARQDGGLLAREGIARDITSRKQAEEELRAADRRKDALVATLAHELRNPLAPIRYATRLLKPGVPVEMAEDARQMIDRQLAQMARLLDDLSESAPRHSQTQLRSLLGCFLFSEDDVFKKIGVLIAESVRHSGPIIRQHLVFQLPCQGPLFLSEVSEKA